MQAYAQDSVPAKLLNDAGKAINEIGNLVGTFTNMGDADAAALQAKVHAPLAWLYATWLTLYSFSVTKNATVSNRSSASVTPGKSTGSANSTRNATVTGLLQRRRPSLTNAPRPREQLAVAKLSSARSVLRTDPGRASSPALRQSG
jgi:hypothetical protein